MRKLNSGYPAKERLRGVYRGGKNCRGAVGTLHMKYNEVLELRWKMLEKLKKNLIKFAETDFMEGEGQPK